MNDEERCQTCRFYREFNNGMIIGQKSLICMRFPPTAFVIGQGQGAQLIYRQPEVRPEGWCGEWQSEFWVPSSTGTNKTELG